MYCCTNQLYKLDPETLALWLRILRRVPGSMLWLLRFPPEAEHNVRAAAASLDPELMAQQPSRLVFSDVAPRDRHLARYACDLHRKGANHLHVLSLGFGCERHRNNSSKAGRWCHTFT